MSDFGDFVNADAFDPSEPPDPEQVARRLQLLRVEAGVHDTDLPWDDLTDGERLVLIAVVGDLLAWLRREGSLR